jgi:A repeated domain in UCH-protein
MQNRKINQFIEQETLKGIYTHFDLQRAYRTLEIDNPENIDDDGLVAVFHSRCADAPEREREFQFSLNIIQYFRGHHPIRESGRNSAEHKGFLSQKHLIIEMDVVEAYQRLHIADIDLPDDLVIASFISYVYLV